MSSTTNPSPPTSLPVDGREKRHPGVLPPSGYQHRDVKQNFPVPPMPSDKHPASFTKTPADIYSPSPEFDGSEDDLPVALVHPDMPFNTVADPRAPRRPVPAIPTPSSSEKSVKASSASTAASTSSDQTRDAVMEMMSMFTTNAAPRRRYTARELAQWRAEEAHYKEKIQEELGGKEICLIRYEARQGWLGFWNQENILDIIDDLRELRAPKS